MRLQKVLKPSFWIPYPVWGKPDPASRNQRDYWIALRF